MERLGDGPKPELNAMAEPRKTSRRRPPPPPLQTLTPLQGCVQLLCGGWGGERFQGRQLTPDLIEPRKEAFFSLTVDRTARTAQIPAVPLRPAPPPQLGGAAASGTHPWRSKEDAVEQGGRQRLRNQLQPEAPSLLCPHSPSSAPYCSA